MLEGERGTNPIPHKIAANILTNSVVASPLRTRKLHPTFAFKEREELVRLLFLNKDATEMSEYELAVNRLNAFKKYDFSVLAVVKLLVKLLKGIPGGTLVRKFQICYQCRVQVYAVPLCQNILFLLFLSGAIP